MLNNIRESLVVIIIFISVSRLKVILVPVPFVLLLLWNSLPYPVRASPTLSYYFQSSFHISLY